MDAIKQMSRLNQILIVALAVQAAVAALVFWPRPAASQESGPLLATFQAEQVTALTISDGETELELAKTGEGWALPERGDYPVTAETVTDLLEKIGQLETDRLVTQTEASHGRLQVASDNFNRKLELTLDDGSTEQLFVGSSGGASATHVRIEGQPEVYLSGDLNAWEINPAPAGWIDTLYFTVPQTATVSLTLENQNGTFTFAREGDQWTMAGLAEDETLNESAVTSLVNQVSSIQMTAPLGREEAPEMGLNTPQATVTLETPEESYTLQVGAQTEADNSYVLKASNSPYYVRVAQFTGDNLVQKTRADFLQAPATEGAAAPALEGGE